MNEKAIRDGQPAVLTVDELRSRCYALRRRVRSVDAGLVAEIENDIDGYRDSLTPGSPELPLMGWLVYEASLAAVLEVRAGFELLDDPQRAASTTAYDLVTRLAEAARRLPFPEYAPRALGAIRAQALAASKRDTAAGYDEAWTLHEEARVKHESYREALAAGDNAPALLATDETGLQLALAEVGTACRTAERVIGRWVEGLTAGDWSAGDEVSWVQRMFRQLSDGIRVGRGALDQAQKIEEEYGFADEVDENRLTLRTALTMPAIMTTRAALLAYALSTEMEGLGRSAPALYEDWADLRTRLLPDIEGMYRLVERAFEDEAVRPATVHRHALVQLRLNVALLVPGHSLPSAAAFHPCLALDPLDEAAVEALSSWLAGLDNGRRRGDANVIGSATMPGFIRAVEACRAEVGVVEGYREWRLRWPQLDRYTAEPGRRERAEAAL